MGSGSENFEVKSLKNDKCCKKFLKGAGSKLRNKNSFVRSLSKALYDCPFCKTKRLKRKYSGLWVCSFCKKELTGSCYIPFIDLKGT